MNIELNTTFTYLLIGTEEIKAWTPAEPFVEVLKLEKDFLMNGCNYETYKDMKIGEVRKDEDYEGILIVRLS